jgi:hypothetical protein
MNERVTSRVSSSMKGRSFWESRWRWIVSRRLAALSRTATLGRPNCVSSGHRKVSSREEYRSSSPIFRPLHINAGQPPKVQYTASKPSGWMTDHSGVGLALRKGAAYT